MAAIPELPQPGVKVIQNYTASAPTIVVPTLAPCVVGACHEINELNDSDGTLNSDILVAGPAIATAPLADANYTAMNNLTLQVSVNGGVTQTFTMGAAVGAMTAAQLAAAINGATVAPVGFTAYVYEDAGSLDYLQLRTTATGSSASLRIVGGTMITTKLGFGTGFTYYGLGTYVQDAVYLKQESFPDPLSIGTQRDITEASIRVFFDLSTESREVLRTESFLRRDTYYTDSGTPAVPADDIYGLTPFDDGDGDQTTPYINLLTSAPAAPNLLAAPGGATVSTAVVNYTADAINVHGLTLGLQLNGGGLQTVTFVGDPVVSAAHAGWTFVHNSTLVVTVDGVTVTTTFVASANIAAVIAAINIASQAAVGVDIAFECDVNGNVGVGYLGLVYGANPAAAAAALSSHAVVAVSDSGAHANEMFPTIAPAFPGVTRTQLLQPNAAGPRDAAWTQINTVMGSTLAALVATNTVFTSATSGYESKIEVAASPVSTSLVGLGLAAGSYFGAPFITRVGDYLYGDGALVGVISEVHAGAVQGRVKLDREVALTLRNTAWYIIAKNLDTVPSAQWGVSVPTPDLRIDTNGDVLVKHDFLRDTTGAQIVQTGVNMYCMYSALRLDVTTSATNPALLSFDSYDALEAALPPVTPANPLSYGLYVAMQNAPASRIYGMGVHAVTADRPYGTDAAFSSAFDFLESEEVYAIAPMTSQLSVATILQTHVNAMSAPDEKMERIGIFHLGTPTRMVDTIVVSGEDGDTIAGPAFDTKIATLSAALLALGIDPTAITVADGVFIDIATDALNWNVTGAVGNGTELTINTTFVAGENDDSFYDVGTFPTVISDTFSIKVRGAAAASLANEVTTVYNRGQSFADRRMWMMQCDQLRASVSGVDSLVAGFFMNAAKAGQVGGLNPALPLTNRPIAVFTGVTGTNSRYSTSQLNQMAAGGADLIVQESEGAALHSRMQVTTKMTTIAEREQSVVKAVDYCAKFYRTSLRAYIGSYNITQSFLDTLSAVVESLSRWLVEEGKVVGGANVRNLLQDEDQPDTVLVDVSLTVLYPLNYLQITLLV